MNGVVERKKEFDRTLICYRCGSDAIKFLWENSVARIYRCNDCGRIIIKRKRGEEKWQEIP